MKFKYELPPCWVEKVAEMEEFANGGTQVSVRLNDGRIIPKVLISNSKYPVAVRGFPDLPFAIGEISEVFQTEEDKSPTERGNWEFWDDWQ
jgi:hypothetical protein